MRLQFVSDLGELTSTLPHVVSTTYFRATKRDGSIFSSTYAAATTAGYFMRLFCEL